jgi:hypothetical protein
MTEEAQPRQVEAAREWLSIAIEADTRRAILETHKKLQETIQFDDAAFCGGYPGWLDLLSS